MFNILFVFFKNLLPISFPRPLITVNLSQCKKFHFNSTTAVIVVEMIFLKKYLAYFLMGVQNLWNHFTICNRHKNFFSLLFAKSKFKVFFGKKNFPTFFNHNSSDQSSTRFYFEKSESKTIHMEISAESLKLLFAMSL